MVPVRRVLLVVVLAAAVVGLAVAGVVVFGRDDNGRKVAASPPPTSTSTTTTVPLDPTGTLREGMTGPQVTSLQGKLLALGYWVDRVDGVYAHATAHAVTAFQKSVSLPATGVADPTTLARLVAATRPAPRSATGRVIEVDLKRQLLLVTRDGRVEAVLDASTGTKPGSTPTGQFQVTSESDRDDPGPGGSLHRPKYFSPGVAVAGSDNVPPTPASQGSVRVTIEAMDWIWANGVIPVGTPVWVY